MNRLHLDVPFRDEYAEMSRSAVMRWRTVLSFLVVQCLDGAFTYLGVSMWGPAIEANPIVSSVVAAAGLGTGLAGAKLVAMGCGILLHLQRVHNIVGVLTAFYLAVAILPWTALFLTN